jgi:ribosomal-protein-alanine N-acetyltransferase
MIVSTERLRLRPATDADVDTLHHIWIDPDVRRFLWDDQVIARETAADVVAASSEDWRERGYGLWVVEENATPIGFAGFRSSEEGPELLFGFLPQWWHRGLAAEAVRAALAFLDRDCWGATDVANTASARVMERAGMTFDRRDTLNGLDTVFYVRRR